SIPSLTMSLYFFFFFFQAEDGIRDRNVTGVQTCALPIFQLSPEMKKALVSCMHDLKKQRVEGNYVPAQNLHMTLAFIGEYNDPRSEEHTSELQSRFDLVCRLLLEKKKKKYNILESDKYKT